MTDRITALNVATGLLIPKIAPSSIDAVIQWLKADLAALDQLRAQLRREDRRVHAPAPSLKALDGMIEAKRTALLRLEKRPTPIQDKE